MIVVVNGNVYAMDKKKTSVLLDIARTKYIKEQAYAIYAIENNDVLEMKRNTYKNSKQLNSIKAEYEALGFKVHFVLKGETK